MMLMCFKNNAFLFTCKVYTSSKRKKMTGIICFNPYKQNGSIKKKRPLSNEKISHINKRK